MKFSAKSERKSKKYFEKEDIFMIYVFLADGFEEVEALATVDMLRRCEFEVQTVGVKSLDVKGSHGIVVLADNIDSMIQVNDDIEAIVLPGGMPGTLNLEKSEYVNVTIDWCAEHGKVIAAICAAPSILGHKGLLDNKRATCFPGFEDQLGKAQYTGDYVTRDGNIITGKGAGVTLDFAFEIASALGKGDKAENVRASVQCSNA